ncbi:MAG: sister chromatid cohesion protein Dcc1 [Monoraphidium minutum]|nr:MAG: sister chromatid cohesion protein Dcc1 [Monoraphidium minutum]
MSLQLSSSRPRQLQYSGAGLRRDLRLLEVEDGLLAEIQRGGVVVKGGAGDDAVLCTQDKTYALKYVETTNSLLLLPPDERGDQEFGAVHTLTPADSSAPRDVGLQTQMQKNSCAESNPPLVATATAVAHIEVVRCLPRLGQLRELLAGCRPYGLEDEQEDGCGGMDVDGDADAPGGRGQAAGGWRQRLAGGGAKGAPAGFTDAQLLELVQASRSELLSELTALGAVRLGGRWRLVDADYLGRLLEVLLLSATENGWPLDEIPLADACQALAADGYRPALVQHCLEVHGRRAGASQDGAAPASTSGAAEAAAGGGGSGAAYALDRARICLHFLRKLLREGPPGAGPPDGGWPRAQLLEAWGDAVPDEWSPPDPGLLAGEVLEELPEGALPGTEPLLAPFAAADLPLEPAPRFAALFKRRACWERPAIEPYLAALVGTGQKAEALLLRYARATQRSPDAPVTFSAR